MSEDWRKFLNDPETNERAKHTDALCALQIMVNMGWMNEATSEEWRSLNATRPASPFTETGCASRKRPMAPTSARKSSALFIFCTRCRERHGNRSRLMRERL